MKTSDLKVELIEEPELCFGYEQTAAFAKDGLLWFGPVDDTQKPTTMRVGFVGSPAALVGLAAVDLAMQPFHVVVALDKFRGQPV